jgi:sulfur relay protein TusB/DsrH
MASYLILISSAPDTKNFVRALSVADNIKNGGNSIAIFFIQDGVRGAVKTSINEQVDRLINSGVICYALDEDLKLRGFEKVALFQNAEIVGHNELVELMTADGVSTIGAF